MEEIYKPIREENGNIEIHSRESSEILGDMPRWLIYTGSYMVYGLVLLLVAGAALFQYPDTVEQPIRIDDTGSAEWITANHTGIMDRFLMEDQAEVKAGDTLGILKNTALLEDVKRFCQVLTNVERYYRTNNTDYLRDYPFDLIMGEMTPAYEQFTQAVRSCLMYQEFDLYPQKKKFLDEELKLLAQSGKADELTLLKARRELFELEIEHKMEINQNRRSLEVAYESMVNSLKTWDNRYLIKCRKEGTVLWGRSWGMGKRISEGDTLCTVLSRMKGTPTGHIRLSENEIADIKQGDRVDIELNKYPSHTYGKLTGEVASVSYTPNNRTYAVEVLFPNGLTTHAGKQISYEIGMSGKAEIVTSSRSILRRIFAAFENK